MQLALRPLLGALLVTCGPLLLLQGRRVRRNTPRLPPAAGPVHGRVEGEGPLLRLVTIGESTVAGVGAAHHDEALTGHLARALYARTGRAVEWSVYGLSGATVAKAHQSFLPAFRSGAADLVVIAFGVNDVLEHTTSRVYADALKSLVGAARSHFSPDVPVLLAAAPPMHKFPALPLPLRAYLGLRATLLDRTAAGLGLPDVVHVPSTVRIESSLFAMDGFHPSPAGYAVWAQFLAEAAIRFPQCFPQFSSTLPSSSTHKESP